MLQPCGTRQLGARAPKSRGPTRVKTHARDRPPPCQRRFASLESRLAAVAARIGWGGTRVRIPDRPYGERAFDG